MSHLDLLLLLDSLVASYLPTRIRRVGDTRRLSTIRAENALRRI